MKKVLLFLMKLPFCPSKLMQICEEYRVTIKQDLCNKYKTAETSLRGGVSWKNYKNTECREGSCRTLAYDWHRFGGENEVCNQQGNHFMRIRTQRDPGACVHICSMGIEGAIQEFLKRRFLAARKQNCERFPDCFLIDLQGSQTNQICDLKTQKEKTKQCLTTSAKNIGSVRLILRSFLFLRA